jgi:hypothetical protein
MAANKHRGEVPVTLAGTEYVMRPSFDVQAAIEVETGMEIIPLARRVAAGNYGARVLATTLRLAINDALPKEERLLAGDVAKAIEEVGTLAFHDAMVRFYVNCLNGGSEPPGEASAAGQS